jgi:hypothetical protein
VSGCGVTAVAVSTRRSGGTAQVVGTENRGRENQGKQKSRWVGGTGGLASRDSPATLTPAAVNGPSIRYQTLNALSDISFYFRYCFLDIRCMATRKSWDSRSLVSSAACFSRLLSQTYAAGVLYTPESVQVPLHVSPRYDANMYLNGPRGARCRRHRPADSSLSGKAVEIPSPSHNGPAVHSGLYLRGQPESNLPLMDNTARSGSSLLCLEVCVSSTAPGQTHCLWTRWKRTRSVVRRDPAPTACCILPGSQGVSCSGRQNRPRGASKCKCHQEILYTQCSNPRT